MASCLAGPGLAPRLSRRAHGLGRGCGEWGQVSSTGRVAVVSGVGAKGTSALELSGGQGLGPEGVGRLAGLLLEAPPPLMAELDLR